MRIWRLRLLALALFGLAPARAADFTLPQALAYPFLSDLVATPAGDRIAWVRIVGGVRNIWAADAPGLAPRQVTQFTADDGQELTQLTWSPDGKTLLFVRGGDHDGNWPAAGNLQPNPTSDPAEPKIMLWRAGLAPGTRAARITAGDAPVMSARGDVAFVRDGQVWLTRLRVTGEGDDVRRAFFDRGKDGALAWSPDGSRLAFVSSRGDHSFIGVYSGAGQPLLWLAPSTGQDGSPVWSPDGTRIAFARLLASGPGWPRSMMQRTPAPWAIWTADAATGAGKAVWQSGKGLHDSFPDVLNGANLHWLGDRLVFLSMADNWPHLYSLPASGGAARLLTPGPFMVEHLAVSPDGRMLAYSANAGALPDDDDRRHLFRVPVDGSAAPVALTAGRGIEWSPAGLASGFAHIAAGARSVPQVAVAGDTGTRILADQAPSADFAGAGFVEPQKIIFRAPDGLLIHGQLFRQPGAAVQPGVIFVHGGPPRQMLLGWSYMRYYANAYALNQYLAARGFTVLSVNYRLGIGYGWDFQNPEKGGPAGAAEYQDVLAGARALQALPGVDRDRIGIWGGSYGGLLTAQALARNSDVFKAGVDIHGVHDWSRIIAEDGSPQSHEDNRDFAAALATAWQASPVADIAGWRSPVLFIHGDDDRNVRVNQTIDLVRRLDGVAIEELIIPDEIHDFLRQQNWQRVDAATADYLERKLLAK
ncbi:MAG: peptidase S9 [Alphaproteobacteria bacterium PA4]|nr:MAG: peptidase S9 [Alphaproteobacteria bacterium PA4]